MDGYEIERKWIVNTLNVIDYEDDIESHYRIEQHYTENNIRLRKVTYYHGKVDYIQTVKSGEGLVRREIEGIISKELFTDLKAIKIKSIEKERFNIKHLNHIISLDVYDDYKFMTVEVEFESVEEAESFIAPDWFDKEVTDDPEFNNFNLAK